MYKEISIKEELPPVGKFVTTIDENNHHGVYRMNEDGTWNMRDADGTNSPNNNLTITHWLKEGNLYLFTYHLSRRRDEGYGNLALVFSSSENEAKKILISKKTIPKGIANAGLAFSVDNDIVPDFIYCLNID